MNKESIDRFIAEEKERKLAFARRIDTHVPCLEVEKELRKAWGMDKFQREQEEKMQRVARFQRLLNKWEGVLAYVIHDESAAARVEEELTVMLEGLQLNTRGNDGVKKDG